MKLAKLTFLNLGGKELAITNLDQLVVDSSVFRLNPDISFFPPGICFAAANRL